MWDQADRLYSPEPPEFYGYRWDDLARTAGDENLPPSKLLGLWNLYWLSTDSFHVEMMEACWAAMTQHVGGAYVDWLVRRVPAPAFVQRLEAHGCKRPAPYNVGGEAWVAVLRRRAAATESAGKVARHDFGGSGTKKIFETDRPASAKIM